MHSRKSNLGDSINSMNTFDCILIPGGGLLLDGSLPPWTQARVDRALEIQDNTRWIACLSGGTVHKPPPVDDYSFPIYESLTAAEYLIKSGLPPEKVLTEICSYDTIGNAYFSRLLFIEPFKLGKILVITSDFHIIRTRTIFEWIYSLTPVPDHVQLSFESVPDEGLSPSALKARLKREKKSLDQLQVTKDQITTLSECFSWLYTEHGAYAPGRPTEILTGDELTSY